MKCDKCGEWDDWLFATHLPNIEWCARCIVERANPYKYDEKLAADMTALKDAVGVVFADLMNMKPKTLVGGGKETELPTTIGIGYRGESINNFYEDEKGRLKRLTSEKCDVWGCSFPTAIWFLPYEEKDDLESYSFNLCWDHIKTMYDKLNLDPRVGRMAEMGVRTGS